MPDLSKLFTTGYGEVREKAGNRFNISCLNCEYLYQSPGDAEEVCQNPNVTTYDIISDEHRVYCSQWQKVNKNKSAKSIFKGRCNRGE